MPVADVEGDKEESDTGSSVVCEIVVGGAVVAAEVTGPVDEGAGAAALGSKDVATTAGVVDEGTRGVTPSATGVLGCVLVFTIGAGTTDVSSGPTGLRADVSEGRTVVYGTVTVDSAPRKTAAASGES